MRRKSSKLIAMYLQAKSRQAQLQVSKALPHMDIAAPPKQSNNKKLNQFLHSVDSDLYYVFKQVRLSQMTDQSSNVLNQFNNKPVLSILNDLNKEINKEMSLTDLFHILINSEDKILLYSQFQEMLMMEKDQFVLLNRTRFVYFHLELLKEKAKIDKSQTICLSLNEETIQLVVGRVKKAQENTSEEINKIKLMTSLQKIKLHEMLFKARELAKNNEEGACVKLYEQIFYDKKASESDRTEALQYLRQVSIKNRSSICLESIMKHIKEQEGLAKHEEYVANAIQQIKKSAQIIQRI